MKFEMETVREVWNDADKSCVEVGPDRDGLGLVEIRYRDEDGAIQERQSFQPEMARMVSAAMLKCAEEIENRKGKA